MLHGSNLATTSACGTLNRCQRQPLGFGGWDSGLRWHPDVAPSVLVPELAQCPARRHVAAFALCFVLRWSSPMVDARRLQRPAPAWHCLCALLLCFALPLCPALPALQRPAGSKGGAKARPAAPRRVEGRRQGPDTTGSTLLTTGSTLLTTGSTSLIIRFLTSFLSPC